MLKKKLALGVALALAVTGLIGATSASAAPPSLAVVSAVPTQFTFDLKDPATGATLRSTVTRSITVPDGKVQVCERRTLIVPGVPNAVISYTCTVQGSFGTTGTTAPRTFIK